MAETSEFPGCCGIEVVHELDTTYGRYDLEDTLDDIDTSVALATTTIRANKPATRAMLEKKGFRPLFAFTNKGTGSRVTLWVKGSIRMIEPKPKTSPRRRTK